MKPKDVFLKAAQGVDRAMRMSKSHRACWAIALAQGQRRAGQSPIREAFVNALLGTEFSSILPWRGDGNTREDMEIRVLLLCLAAAMAETGDLVVSDEQ